MALSPQVVTLIEPDDKRRANPTGGGGLLLHSKSQLFGDPLGAIVGTVEPQRIDPDLKFDDDIELWHQQPGEPDKAFFALCIFIELGPGNRTTAATHRQYKNLPEGAAVHSNFMNLWRRTYKWDERARAYDQAVNTRLRRELQERQLASRMETALLGERMRRMAADLLEGKVNRLFVAEITRDPETGADVSVLRLKNDVTINEIVRLADAGAKLERLALELDTSGGSGRPQVQVNVGLYNQVSKRDIREEARQVLNEQERVLDVTHELLGLSSDS